jgi:hypothetical protein
MLRRILGLNSWRGLHSEEFYNLYASPNIIRVMKLRSMTWAGHAEFMGDEKCK